MVLKDDGKGAEQIYSAGARLLWDGLYTSGRSHLLIVDGQRELGEVIFLLHDKDLGRARRVR